jgi:hypothetical protein
MIVKQEEIALFIEKVIGAEAQTFPRGTPRSVDVKSVPKKEGEADRLKLKLWYSGGGYVTAVIAGLDSSWGVGWSVEEYGVRWEYSPTNPCYRPSICRIKTVEHAGLLESISHWQMRPESYTLDQDDLKILRENIIVQKSPRCW